MKKKFFMGVAAAALIAGGFAMSKNSTGKVLTPLQAENLEALSGDELITKIPCKENLYQTCKFSAIDAYGRYGTVELARMERVYR